MERLRAEMKVAEVINLNLEDEISRYRKENDQQAQNRTDSEKVIAEAFANQRM